MAIINRIGFAGCLLDFLERSLFSFECATGFCVLILARQTLYDAFVSSNSIHVKSVYFPRYRIISINKCT